jgi:methyl-accepting chemotaxis protein
MTNDELLKKIYDDTQMMKTELTSVKETTEGLVTGLKEVREETKGLATGLEELREETKELAADMKSVKEDTKELRSRMSAIELNLENETNKNIRILAENHLSLMEKLDEAIKVSNRHFLYELKVSSLDRRVTEIERRIQS